MEKTFTKLKRTLLIQTNPEKAEVRIEVQQSEKFNGIHFNVKELEGIIETLKQAHRELSGLTEQENDDYRPIGILNVPSEIIPPELYNKLHNKKAWTYEDKKGLQEHLFSCEVRNNGDIETFWTKEQEEVLIKIEQECAEKDCGYFRIINS